MRIGPRKSAEISTIAHADARNEKAHRMRLGAWRLGEREKRTSPGSDGRSSGKQKQSFHFSVPDQTSATRCSIDGEAVEHSFSMGAGEIVIAAAR
jgi:hypothetical protein